MPRGEPLTEKQSDSFAAATGCPGRSLRVRHGWSTERVNAALVAWASFHAGRPDISFEYFHAIEPVSVALTEAVAISEAIDGGLEPTYLVDRVTREDGTTVDIRMSDAVMETMLDFEVGE